MVFLAVLAACYTEVYERRVVHGRVRLDRVTKEDVLKLHQAGVSPEIVREKIRQDGAERLTSDDVIELKREGVSEEVIRAMIESRTVTPY